jgi:hypothetical protein
MMNDSMLLHDKPYQINNMLLENPENGREEY